MEKEKLKMFEQLISEITKKKLIEIESVTKNIFYLYKILIEQVKKDEKNTAVFKIAMQSLYTLINYEKELYNFISPHFDFNSLIKDSRIDKFFQQELDYETEEIFKFYPKFLLHGLKQDSFTEDEYEDISDIDINEETLEDALNISYSYQDGIKIAKNVAQELYDDSDYIFLPDIINLILEKNHAELIRLRIINSLEHYSKIKINKNDFPTDISQYEMPLSKNPFNNLNYMANKIPELTKKINENYLELIEEDINNALSNDKTIIEVKYLTIFTDTSLEEELINNTSSNYCLEDIFDIDKKAEKSFAEEFGKKSAITIVDYMMFFEEDFKSNKTLEILVNKLLKASLLLINPRNLLRFKQVILTYLSDDKDLIVLVDEAFKDVNLRNKLTKEEYTLKKRQDKKNQ